MSNKAKLHPTYEVPVAGEILPPSSSFNPVKRYRCQGPDGEYFYTGSLAMAELLIGRLGKLEEWLIQDDAFNVDGNRKPSTSFAMRSYVQSRMRDIFSDAVNKAAKELFANIPAEDYKDFDK